MYFDDNIREKLKSYTDANGKTIDNYPALRKYAKPLKKAERPIIGREVEMDRVMASLMRPELCNVMLLAEGLEKRLKIQRRFLFLICVDMCRLAICLSVIWSLMKAVNL